MSPLPLFLWEDIGRKSQSQQFYVLKPLTINIIFETCPL